MVANLELRLWVDSGKGDVWSLHLCRLWIFFIEGPPQKTELRSLIELVSSAVYISATSCLACCSKGLYRRLVIDMYLGVSTNTSYSFSSISLIALRLTFDAIIKTFYLCQFRLLYRNVSSSEATNCHAAPYSIYLPSSTKWCCFLLLMALSVRKSNFPGLGLVLLILETFY